ncbi:MAG: hypothetical protein AB7G93_09775 [Bdellovibrionales bacterium]
MGKWLNFYQNGLRRAIGVVMALTGFSIQAQTGPASLNISGGLYKPDGTAIMNSNVNLRFELYDKNSTCVLYSEEHVGVDLSVSSGRFSLPLGHGSNAQNYLEGTTSFTSRLFHNDGVSQVFTGCAAGVTLSSGDERVIRVHYDLGDGYVAMSPDVGVESSAFAMVADTLRGKTPSDFVQLRDDATYDLTQANVENLFSATNYARLNTLLSSSGNFSFGNQRITSVADPSSLQDVATKNYSDTYMAGKQIDLQNVGAGTGDGKVLSWDAAQSKWVARAVSVTDSTKLPLAGGTMSGPIEMAGNDLVGVGRIMASGTVGIGTTNPSNQLEVRTSTAGIAAIYAANSDTTSGSSYGIYASTASNFTGGTAVYGVATGAGYVYGVRGTTSSTSGYGVGVIGSSSAGGGNSAGVVGNHYSGGANLFHGGQFSCAGSNCHGVTGLAARTTGSSFGGYFTAATTGAGTGVYASITGANNTGYAVRAYNDSAAGWGIFAYGDSPNYFAGKVGIGTSAPGAELEVKGSLRLSGSTSGYVGLAPAAAAGSTTYTLPASDATVSGQALTSNGSGTLSWSTMSSASITPYNVAPGASATEFLFFGGSVSGVENDIQAPFPYAATIRNVYIRTTGAQPASGSMVLTLRKNSVDCNIVISVNAGSAAGTFSNTSDSCSVAAGDLLSWRLVNNAGATAANLLSISVQMTP